MNIKGWAFGADEEAASKRNSDRYDEIKHFASQLGITKRPDYAHTHFTGTLTEETKHLSEHDLALIADHGNLCFGGACTKSGDRFSGHYITD